MAYIYILLSAFALYSVVYAVTHDEFKHFIHAGAYFFILIALRYVAGAL